MMSLQFVSRQIGFRCVGVLLLTVLIAESKLTGTPSSVGYPINLMPPCKPLSAGAVLENNSVVIEVKLTGTFINGTKLYDRPLLPTLKQIFRTRARRIIFVDFASELSMERVMHILDEIRADSFFSHVVLLTPKQIVEYSGHNCVPFD